MSKTVTLYTHYSHANSAPACRHPYWIKISITISSNSIDTSIIGLDCPHVVKMTIHIIFEPALIINDSNGEKCFFIAIRHAQKCESPCLDFR
jgi:hypothetical protein